MLPYYKFYPRDYLASRAFRLLTLEEQGLYRILLDIAWTNGMDEEVTPSLPNDREELAAEVSLSPEEFGRLWAKVGRFWQESRDGFRLVNKRLTREFGEIKGRASANRRNGGKGGRPKTQPEPKPNPQETQSKPMRNPMASRDKTDGVPIPEGRWQRADSRGQRAEGGSGAPARAEIGFKPESRSRSPDAVMSSGGHGPMTRIGFAEPVRLDDAQGDVAQELLRLWPKHFPSGVGLDPYTAEGLAVGFDEAGGGWPGPEQLAAVERLLKCAKWWISRPKIRFRVPGELLKKIMSPGNEGYRAFVEAREADMKGESAAEEALHEALRRRRERR